MAMNKPINIRRNFYTMAGNTGEDAEITMYGEIVESQPTDWWTGEPVEGEYIVQSEFLGDLEQVSDCKKLTIRMNSLGGDAGVSILIHNRLRELSNNGTEITCIVDGVAMSGGSLIMCACDKVRVNPSSLIMIHKCWGFLFGGYNADNLRDLAKSYDAWDDAQVAIYKRKCKLSDTVISHMMGETTYMTGEEAVEKGFADELITDAEPLNLAASASRTSLYVNGKAFHLARGMTLPESIPTVSTSATEDDIKTKTPGSDTGSLEGGTPMATNLEELRTENAPLAATIESEVRAAVSAENTEAVNQAVNAERQRISEIDEISCLYDAETVREAKYGNPCSAQEMAFRAATKAAKTGSAFMANAMKDYQQSGAAGVPATPGTSDEGKPKTKEEHMDEARSMVSEVLGKKKED